MESTESIRRSIEKIKEVSQSPLSSSAYLPSKVDYITTPIEETSSLKTTTYLPKALQGAMGTYEIISQINLEIAKELQAQTGLVVPFEPGKESAEFIVKGGNFGKLRLGKGTKTGRYVGIKAITEKDKVKESLQEARIQKRLTGLPYLMPLIDAIELEDTQGYKQLYHIMPLAALGNGEELSNYLSNIKDNRFKEALLVHVAKCVLKGFKELHEKEIAHLDFKPANLVVDVSGNILVIDFGCALALDEKGYVTPQLGTTVKYYSPERRASNWSFPGKAADCYAIGVTLLELAVGMIIKKGSSAEDYLNHPYLQKAMPGTYAGLVKGLLEIKPDKRLKIEEALSLPLFLEETKPEILSYLREFVQSLQWEQRVKEAKGIQQHLTSAQQLPLPHFTSYVHRPIEGKVLERISSSTTLPIACTGMGGVGKTQLLTYLVHSPEVQASFKSIFWFRAADNETSLNIQYHGLAKELKLIDDKTPLEEAKKVLIGWFEQQSQTWLIVFDNADNPELLNSYLPSKGGTILLSSRSPQWQEAIPVDILTLQEVQEMMSKLMPERTITLEEAKEIGEMLGYLPLALSQAIAMIRQENINIKAYSDSFKQKQKELLSEAELHVINARLQGGMLNKAKRGELKIPLPIGYIYDDKEKIIKDPDQQIQTCIGRIFSNFERTKTACSVVRTFHQEGWLFPHKITCGMNKGDLTWVKIAHSRVLQILHNPRYTGAFVYGRRQTKHLVDGKSMTKMVPQEKWLVLKKDSYPAYISWEQYERNQRILHENAQARGTERHKGPPREGNALLQGIVICGHCGKFMTIRYHLYRGKPSPDYVCQREGIQSGKSSPCQAIVGKHIDKAIGELIVELMSPVTLELSIAVQKELEQRWQESDQLWQQQLERARYEAELAKRRYLKVDPDNRLVSCTLESDWNEKLEILNKLHEEHENYKTQKLSKITKLQQERIMALSKDFATLWYAENTPMQERKRMVRLLIDDVTLKKTEKGIEVHMRFRGGQIKSLHLPLPLNITKLRVTEPKVIELIDKLSEDYTDAKIADILNKQGYRPAVKEKFDLLLVQSLRGAYKIVSHYDKLRKKGYLTAMELAKKLKVSTGTVNQWARNKILKGYFGNDKGERLFEMPSKKLWPIKRQGSPLSKRKKVCV